MKMIDADALAERISNLKHQIASRAAGWVDEDSYECGAVDALYDVLGYIDEAETIPQYWEGEKMAKLETFDNKQTNWEGLWWHSEYNGFSSDCIDLSALKKFKGKVRLYVRKNKFYNNGENGRPNYNFCLKDAQADIFHILEVEEDEKDDVPRDKDGNRLYTEEEVWRVIHGMECEYRLSYGNNLISDYV